MTTKEPEDRWVPILPEGEEILTARREKYGDQPLVFPNLLGRQWSDSQFSRYFAMLRKRAKLDKPDANGEMLVAYSLRHTRLTEAGVKEQWSYPVLRRMCGHARGSKITMRYMHPDKEDLKREAVEGAKRRLAGRETEKPAT
jgi:integrase